MQPKRIVFYRNGGETVIDNNQGLMKAFNIKNDGDTVLNAVQGVKIKLGIVDGKNSSRFSFKGNGHAWLDNYQQLYNGDSLPDQLALPDTTGGNK